MYDVLHVCSYLYSLFFLPCNKLVDMCCGHLAYALFSCIKFADKKDLVKLIKVLGTLKYHAFIQSHYTGGEGSWHNTQ